MGTEFGTGAGRRLAAGDVPFSDSDLANAIELRRKAIRERKERRLKEIEAECDDALGRIDLALAALHGEGSKAGQRGNRQRGPEPGSDAPPAREPRRRRRGKASTKPADARKRREGMLRLARESEGSLAVRDFVRELNLTVSSVQSGLARLCENGFLEREGTGSATRYLAVPVAGSSPVSASETTEGTLSGRILEILRDRSWAWPEELAQALGVPLAVVERECARLILEEEVWMDRRDGRPTYVYVEVKTDGSFA